jgi:hypothetical protein
VCALGVAAPDRGPDPLLDGDVDDVGDAELDDVLDGELDGELDDVLDGDVDVPSAVGGATTVSPSAVVRLGPSPTFHAPTSAALLAKAKAKPLPRLIAGTARRAGSWS